jgi:hypothetical protein
MPTRVFETTQLIEWGVHEYYECEHVLEMEEDGMDKFEVDCHLVLKAPDDGRLWRIEFQINNGAGFNDFTGISYGDNLRPEQESFLGTEVEPKQKTITVYTTVPDPEPVTMEMLTDLLGLVMAKTGGTVMAVDLSDVPSPDTLEKLTPEQREELAQWAADCHLEASDNDVRPGPCPQPLRDMLPGDHPYKTWRVE